MNQRKPERLDQIWSGKELCARLDLPVTKSGRSRQLSNWVRGGLQYVEKSGRRYFFEKDVCDGRKVQTLTADLTGTKKIATMFGGWMEAYIVKPDFKDIRKEGVTATRQDVTVYYLKEKEQIPYLVKGKLKIGSLVARLRKLKKK